MAFWRFGFAQDSAIDTLLKEWEASCAAATGISSSPSKSTGNDAARPEQSTSSSSSILKTATAHTLDQLLDEDDLLQECKAGHAKLLEFLSSSYAVVHMLAYISGELFEEQESPQRQNFDSPPDPPPKDNFNSKNDLPSPKAAVTPKSAHSPLRSSLQTSEGDKELVRKRLKTERHRFASRFPYLCTEILHMDQWQVTETIFRDTDTYLLPFWNSILDKSASALSTRSVQVGHWSKVNILWLSNTRVPQMVQFLKSIPALFPRLLTHLPYVSPIFDILTKLINTDDSHPQLQIISWLYSEDLISQVLALLDPINAPIEAHVPAGEFLRGIIAAASAASASKQQQQQQQQQQQAAKFGEIDSNSLGLNGDKSHAWSDWPNNTLVREIASEKTIKRLLGYMLDARPVRKPPSIQDNSQTAGSGTEKDVISDDPSASPQNEPIDAVNSGIHSDMSKATLQSIPNMSTADHETPVSIRSPLSTSSPPSILPGESGALSFPSSGHSNAPSAEAATSSLLNSLTVIIDLIRKNNSDFTELQILQYLERANAAALDDESEEERGGEGEGEDMVQHDVMEHGPSLVALGPLLTSITARLPDLHQLLLHPRSGTGPVATTLQNFAVQEPLTFERFRICELYAEMLHCSNMAILNRPSFPSSASEDDNVAPAYDIQSGRILGSQREALERLSTALNAHPAPAPSPEMNTSSGANNDIHDDEEEDEGIVEDISLADEDAETDNRPVTAASEITSSYNSEASDRVTAKDESEDAMDFLHSAADSLSLEEASRVLNGPTSPKSSTQNSHVPPLASSLSAASSSSTPSDFLSEVKSTVTDNGALPSLPELTEPEAQEQELLPGAALKKAFIDLQIVPSVLDLFFRFPWNNFLHNVVYDLIQQIFNGKLELRPNRDLCMAVFTQGDGLVQRVLDTVEQNSKIVSMPQGVRLGHMGHLTLISEEIVKLFYNMPKEMLPFVDSLQFDREKWEGYVEGTLRETRERDLQPLGGGVSLAMHASGSNGAVGGSPAGIREMDDEFPSGTASGSRNLFSAEEGDSPDTSPEKAHFARYLASQISSDFTGPAGINSLNRSTSSSSSSGSSSSDDGQEDRSIGNPSGLQSAAATWFSSGNEGDSAFDDYDDDDDLGIGANKNHQDFDVGVGTSAGTKVQIRRQEKSDFNERFDPLDPHQYGTGDSDDEDDDNFGPFSDSYATTPSPQASTTVARDYTFDDNFENTHPARTFSATGTAASANHTKLTPADWNSSFRSSYDTGTGTRERTHQPSFGEFGDFSAIPGTPGGVVSPNIFPQGEFDDDDDFGEFTTGDDSAKDGDYDFSQGDGLQSQSGSSGTVSKASSAPPPIPTRRSRSVSMGSSTETLSPSLPGDEVTGPGVHEGAHISKDGLHVEAEIEMEGETVTVQVPKDELALHPEKVQ